MVLLQFLLKLPDLAVHLFQLQGLLFPCTLLQQQLGLALLVLVYHLLKLLLFLLLLRCQRLIVCLLTLHLSLLFILFLYFDSLLRSAQSKIFPPDFLPLLLSDVPAQLLVPLPDDSIPVVVVVDFVYCCFDSFSLVNLVVAVILLRPL